MIFFVCPCSQDSRGNTIGQWLNVTSQSKMVQLSHVLNPEALQGKYTLSVTGKQSAFSHEFQVKKYGTLLQVYLKVLFCFSPKCYFWCWLFLTIKDWVSPKPKTLM